MYKQAYARKDFNRNNTNQDEINPKTLRLDNLVLLIEPEILAHYLEKVAAFLRSNKRDLWFPDVSPYLDAFLVRVIRDVQNFTSLYKCLDEKSMKAAEEIVALLIANKGVYRLDHKYDSMLFKQNVLVYKKVYEGMPQMDRLSHLAFARAALEEEAREAADPPDLRQAIPTSFKVQWLKSIIKFIEDETLQNVEYPEMSITEADFVYSLVRPDKLSALVGVGFKALYAPLEESLKALSFEIKASFLHVGSDKVRLSLEKAPRNDKTDEKPKHATMKTQCNAKYVTKIEQALLRKQKFIDNLDSTFMKTSLHMILDFISTEAEASIVFKNADENQSLFIQSAGAMAKNKKFHSLFTEDMKVILRKMANVLAEHHDYELKVGVTKMDKDTKLRTVSLVKSPKCSPDNSPPESQNNNKQTSGSSLESSNTTPSINSEKKNTTIHSESNNTNIKEEIKPPIDKVSQTIDEPKPLVGINNQPPLKKEPIESSKDKTLPTNNNEPVPKKEPIINSKDKILLNNNSSDAVNRNTTPQAIQAIDTKSLGPRKAKLIEAMSTPLECDIATRMMRQMGWEGGPLGIRGEGIVEPIIPALHLAAKAGFGHVKEISEPKDNGKVPLRFRIHLYHEILHLLTENVEKREIEYSAALNKKEKACAVNIIQAFSNRSNIQENDDKAMNLIRNISKEMFKAPALTLLYNVLPKNVLVITKFFNLPNIQNKTSPILPSSNFKMTDILQKHINFEKHVTRELVLIIGKNIYPSNTRKKAAKSVGHRLLILYRLYTFLMTNEVQCEIYFEYNLTKKHMLFVNGLVSKFNVRSKPTFSTPSENEIWADIKRIVCDNNLGLEYANDYQKIIFQKTNRHNRSMNSAKQKCDVVNNNTILSNKNKIIEAKKEDVKYTNKVKIPEDTIKVKTPEDTIKVKIPEVTNKVKIPEDTNKVKIPENTNKVNIPQNTNKVKIPEHTNKNMSVKIESKVDKKIIDTEVIVISDDSSEEIENNKMEAPSDDVSDGTSVSDFEKELRDLEKAILNTGITIKNEIDNSSHSSKRSRSDTSDLMHFSKKTKYQQHIRHLLISNESKEELKTEIVQKFQNVISEKLDEVDKLPLLECHGVKDGAIIYSCHNDAGLLLVNSVASEMNLKATDTTNNFKEKRRHKMKIKLNSFIGVNLKKLFSRMEFYNVGLTTDFWSVLDVHTYNDFIVIYVEIDDESFEYITEANFSLFAGIDKVRFSITWD